MPPELRRTRHRDRSDVQTYTPGTRGDVVGVVVLDLGASPLLETVEGTGKQRGEEDSFVVGKVSDSEAAFSGSTSRRCTMVSKDSAALGPTAVKIWPRDALLIDECTLHTKSLPTSAA
jgi:hypothetical protein